jgi:hypothetical protein
MTEVNHKTIQKYPQIFDDFGMINTKKLDYIIK